MIRHSGVTIKDLTIDGGAGQGFRSGIVTDYNTDDYSYTVVDTVAVNNIYRRGVYLVADTGHITGNQILNSTFDNIGTSAALRYEDGDAIVLIDADATVSGNAITRSSIGIASNYYNGTQTAGVLIVTGNTINMPVSGAANGAIGMDLSGLADGSLIGGAPGAVIPGTGSPGISVQNTINMTGGSSHDIGMVLQYAVGQVTVQNNAITTDQGDTGIQFYKSSPAAKPVLIRDNVLVGGSTGTGVLASYDGTRFGEDPTAYGDNYATLLHNTISGYATGIGVIAGGAQPAIVTIGDGTTTGSNTITSNATGVLLSGSGTSATITGNTFTNNGIQVQGADSSGFDTATILAGNTFDRAVTVNHSSTLLPTIWGSIQAGVNAAAPSGGDTVNVAAGIYVENVTVTKPLELAGVGQSAVTIEPSFSGPCVGASGSLPAGSSNVILVQADNVTIDGLTVEGDNPNLTSNVVRNSADIDARNGIIVDYNFGVGVFNNLSVHNVTIKDIYLRGLYASSGGTFNFTNNTVDNVQGEAESVAIMNWGGSGIIQGNHVSNASDAISANWSTGTQFLNNVITSSGSGVHTDNNGGFGGVADLIQGNQVSDSTPGGYGVWTFAPYVSPTVQYNIVTNVDVGLTASGSQVAGATTHFIGNTVDGQGKTGSTGIYVTTSLFGWGDADVTAVFTNNLIKNNTDGMYVEEDRNADMHCHGDAFQQ